MLRLQNLVKKFGPAGAGLVAVDNLSFSVAPQQIYALIGPNGAGKTTTIKMIVGLYRSDSGSITLFGRDITRDNEVVRASVGYIPDEPIFYPYLTGREFLEFIKRLYGLKEGVFRKKLADLLDLYPIGGILSDYPENYSRGNKQKLSIISAFLHEPKLLVIDEPIVGLDPVSAEVTRTLLNSFAKKGGMILVSTHTLSFVEELASKVGFIDRGRMIKEGTLSAMTKTVSGAKNLSAAFILLSKNRSSSNHV